MIREARIDDAAAAAALRAIVTPELVVTPETYAYRMRTTPPAARRRWWCADADGDVVGLASAGLVVETSEPGVVAVDLDVHPDHRRRGIGAELLARVEEHARAVGGRRLFAWGRNDDATRGFAGAHGYAESSSSEMLVVDPRDVERPEVPPGVELRPFAAFEDDPSPIYRADTAAVVDEPHEVRFDSIGYDGWLERWWGQPIVDREASIAAVADGTVVAITWLHADRALGRAWNNGTGTLPGYRGRGLAQLVKRESLARAAELGITAVYTGNLAENAPMLAVNRKLGYRPYSTMLTFVKTLDVTSESST